MYIYDDVSGMQLSLCMWGVCVCVNLFKFMEQALSFSLYVSYYWTPIVRLVWQAPLFTELIHEPTSSILREVGT